MRVSVVAKISLSFLVIILFSTASGIISFNSLQQNERIQLEVYEALEFQKFLIEKENDHLHWVGQFNDMFVLDLVPEKLTDHTECGLGRWYYSANPPESLPADTDDATHAITTASLARGDRNKEIYDELGIAHLKVHETGQLALELYGAGKVRAAIEVYTNETTPAIGDVQLLLHEMIETEDMHIASLLTESNAVRKKAIASMLVPSILSVLAAIAAALYIYQQIAQPIGRMSVVAGSIAKGDLRNATVKHHSRDEIGDLASSLTEMTLSLRSIIGNVQEQAGNMTHASDILAASADESGKAAEHIAIAIQNVAQGGHDATERMYDLSSVATSLQEAASTAVHSANNTLGATGQTAAAAEQGVTAAEQAVVLLDRVAQKVDGFTEVIAALSERCDQVGEIVQLIEGLAKQTNLLALNASIEAARAGEQGRGFAVVADAVRNLADESRDATSNITELIAAMQKETNAANVAMAAEAVEIGRQVSTIKESMAGLAVIATIATATEQEAQQFMRIGDDLTKHSHNLLGVASSMTRIMEENAAGAEEISAATEEQTAGVQEVGAAAAELRNLASQLDQLVRNFRLE